jgi:hypothetical protein
LAKSNPANFYQAVIFALWISGARTGDHPGITTRFTERAVSSVVLQLRMDPNPFRSLKRFGMPMCVEVTRFDFFDNALEEKCGCTRRDVRNEVIPEGAANRCVQVIAPGIWPSADFIAEIFRFQAILVVLDRYSASSAASFRASPA